MHETDIGSSQVNGGYIVTGFFTPDYAPLARRFGEALTKHAIPHMLYNWCQREWGKAILDKPLVVQRAMQDFPGRTVVLMDIDCEIRGPIAPIVECAGDICLFIGVGINPEREKGLRMRAIPSSRIIVFRPTDGAHRLVGTWQRLCQQQAAGTPITDDEQLLMRAIGATEGLTLTILDRRYSARNPWDAPEGAVIIRHTASGNTPWTPR
jgi:hypothetical protein